VTGVDQPPTCASARTTRAGPIARGQSAADAEADAEAGERLPALDVLHDCILDAVCGCYADDCRQLQEDGGVDGKGV
jgi:hypothetical protein